MDRPVVSEAEFEWMQDRLRENQRLAKKNSRLRFYLLRGLVKCNSCGRSYVGVTRKNRSYYYCGARWKPQPNGERCDSAGFAAPVLENAVFETVNDFLCGPEGFEAEMRRRSGLTKSTEDSLRRERIELKVNEREEKEAEAKLLRLASRTTISDDVFGQELGLIRTRRQWIAGQTERLDRQLEELERHTVNPGAVAVLRRRLESRLKTATEEDRRFVLEAVGASVIAQADGRWELEVQVPTHAPEEVQIVNSRPGSKSHHQHFWNADCTLS